MTEYQLLTQGAGHDLAPAYDGRDPMRNRPLLNGTNTSMMINRYGLGREHTNMVGSPAIVGCADGEYVRHDDHAALISELQAELAGVERTVVAQTVTIAELRVDHSGGANDMVGIPVPPDPVAWRIDYTCPRNCGSVVYHGHNAIADYRDIDPNATSTPLFEQPSTSAQPSVLDGWRVKRVGDAVHIERPNGQWCGYMRGVGGPAHDLTYDFLSAMLTAAPTPPADGQARPVCKGCMALRSGCGKCSRCKAEITAQPDPAMAVHIPSDEIETLRMMRAEYDPGNGPMSTLKARALDAAIGAMSGQAMAGNEWLRTFEHLESEYSATGSDKDRRALYAHARKRVQPASGNGKCSVCHPYNCYGCDPCKQASGEDAKPVDPKAVWMAAIDCPHVIDDNTITLRYTDKQAGHGALDQLARRVMAAMQQEAK